MSDEKNLDQQPEVEDGADFIAEPVSDDELENVSGGLQEFVDDGGCGDGHSCGEGYC